MLCQALRRRLKRRANANLAERLRNAQLDVRLENLPGSCELPNARDDSSCSGVEGTVLSVSMLLVVYT